MALFYETKNNLLGNIESILLSVLTACAHGGLIKEAQNIFDNIPTEKRTVKMWNALVSVKYKNRYSYFLVNIGCIKRYYSLLMRIFSFSSDQIN